MALGAAAANGEIATGAVEKAADSVLLVGAVVGANAGLLAAFMVCSAALSMAFNAVTWPYSGASFALASSRSARSEKGFFPKVFDLGMLNSCLRRTTFWPTNPDLFPDLGTARF